MTAPLYSISISARATLDMHSLNNEGGTGNQIQTRMVNIIDQDGCLQNVNAISGDMFKHIQAEHLFRVLSELDGVPLCAGCREFNANRINADADFIARNLYVGEMQSFPAALNVFGIQGGNEIINRFARFSFNFRLLHSGRADIAHQDG